VGISAKASGPRPIKTGGGPFSKPWKVQSLWQSRLAFVADVNELSSLTFRLAFSDTYGDSINSGNSPSSRFSLTNNFPHGFQLQRPPALRDRCGDTRCSAGLSSKIAAIAEAVRRLKLKAMEIIGQENGAANFPN